MLALAPLVGSSVSLASASEQPEQAVPTVSVEKKLSLIRQTEMQGELDRSLNAIEKLLQDHNEHFEVAIVFARLLIKKK